MTDRIFVHRRFCGPPDSGNGGYVCGLVAQKLDGIVEVRLLKPPPLEKPMTIEITDDGRALLKDGDVVIAQGKASSLDLDAPSPPSFDDASEASKRYIGLIDHFFPTCFVCGPARGVNDGLRIFPGTAQDKAMVASAWIPDETLADESGRIKREFIWASLDCPGAFAVLSSALRPVVLGSLTADITRHPAIGQRCVVIGWEIGVQGRKRSAGTALFTDTGEMLAKAQAVWIEL